MDKVKQRLFDCAVEAMDLYNDSLGLEIDEEELFRVHRLYQTLIDLITINELLDEYVEYASPF